MIEIRQVSQSDPEFEEYKKIRHLVFVEEQGVPAVDEFDEYESKCKHYLAFNNGKPCGTARWRPNGSRFKMERFAVLPDQRGLGIGSALVKFLENVISQKHILVPGSIYMHAQNKVLEFYKGLGYSTEGDEFEECGIKHTQMKK